MACTGLTLLRIGTSVEGSCEYGKERLGSTGNMKKGS
jgi:hypothetical protein